MQLRTTTGGRHRRGRAEERGPLRGRLAGVAVVTGLLLVLGGPAPAVGAPADIEHGSPAPAAWSAGAVATLTLAADQPELPVGRAVTLTGRLTAALTGSPIEGDVVRLEAQAPASGAWEPVQDLVTGAAGEVATSVVPEQSTRYRLARGAPGSAEEATSPEVRVHLTTLTAALDTRATRAGRSVALRGVLVAAPGSLLRLEQWVGGHWAPAGRTRTAADQSYAFTVTPTSPGWWRWRVVREPRGGAARSVAAPARLDAFRVHTYSVTTRGRVRADLAEFRSAVAAIYDDPRGWRRAHHRFVEVPRGGAFTVVLARPEHLPGFSRVCSPTYSCRVGRYVILNAVRWAQGSPYFPGTLRTYRRYLVGHETGHWLGLGHASCPRRGAPAPVMQQQSKGMQGCRPNAWPLPHEVRAAA